MQRRRLFVALSALLVTGAASAQDAPSMQVEHFEPLADPTNNILNVSGSSILPHLGFNGGMFFHYAKAPLKLLERDSEGNETRSALIDHQFKGEVWMALGLEDIANFSIVLPMTLSQSGVDLAPAGQPGVTPEGFAMGDVRLTPKVRFMKPENFGGFGLAFAIPVSFPTGDNETLNSEGVMRWEPRLVADYTHDWGFSVAVNLGYQFRAEAETIRNIVRDDMFKWSLGARSQLGVEGLEAMLSVFGSVQLEDDVNPLNPDELNEENFNTPAELLVGVGYQLPWAPVYASVGGGAGLSDGVGSPEYRIFFNVGYVPFLGDTDGDGIIDREDACPDEPEDKDGFADADGCIDADNDEDGVLDAADTCRDVAEDPDGWEDEDGCPDLDNDGDGVPDATDQCADSMEDADGFKDDDGCIDEDNDGDGILDTADACRDSAEDMDGYMDEDGCPEYDNDGDGFCDPYVQEKGLTVTVCQGVDKCPMEKEIINGVDDTDGCPDEGKSRIEITEKSINILDKVYFDTGKATIQKKSFPVLDQVSAALVTNPQLTKVQVEGHTDNTGDAAKNKTLSQERAEAVKQYLIGKGVTGERLVAIGFGQEVPIDDNGTKAGRANNRRVEFKILEIDGKLVE